MEDIPMVVISVQLLRNSSIVRTFTPKYWYRICWMEVLGTGLALLKLAIEAIFLPPLGRTKTVKLTTPEQ